MIESKGRLFMINCAIGTGVKYCPASCLRPVVSSSSKKSDKYCCLLLYRILYPCINSTTSFTTFAFSSNAALSYTSLIANSLFFSRRSLFTSLKRYCLVSSFRLAQRLSKSSLLKSLTVLSKNFFIPLL